MYIKNNSIKGSEDMSDNKEMEKEEKNYFKMITISREYGSGGSSISGLLAEKLGLPYYNKDIMKRVAEESGFALEFIEESGEYTTSSLLFNMAAGNMFSQSVFSAENMPIADRLHLTQNKIILDIATKESAVILGRSADYILKKHTQCLNVFIHANPEARAKNVAQRDSISIKEAEKLMNKKDKARAAQYKYYSGLPWGNMRNYHMCLDSSKLGFQTCCDLIADAWEKMKDE